MEIAPDIQPDWADFSDLQKKVEKIERDLKFSDTAQHVDCFLVGKVEIDNALTSVARIINELNEHKRLVEHIIIQLSFPNTPRYCLEFSDHLLHTASNMIDALIHHPSPEQLTELLENFDITGREPGALKELYETLVALAEAIEPNLHD